MPRPAGLSLSNRKEKCCDSTYSRSRPARVVECAQQTERGVWSRESTEGAGRPDGQDDSRGPDDQDYILSKPLWGS